MLLKKKIPVKYVFSNIKFELIFISIYAVIIGVLDENLHIKNISVATGVPMILGTIISLLLAFRSNQAYDRWWEARIIWGAIVNDSRSLSRLILTFIEDNDYSVEKLEFKENFIKRQIAWTYSLGNYLRNKNPLENSAKFLTPKELSHIEQFDHVPNGLLLMHSLDIKKAYENKWINSFQQIEIEKHLSRLCDSMGKCERIKNTVFPTTYSLYINFSLWIFIMLFPFALTSYFGLFEIPLMIAISSALLLVEKMAVQLQDPFENKPTDIPVSAIARSIDRNLRHMLNETPETLTNDKELIEFYIM